MHFSHPEYFYLFVGLVILLIAGVINFKKKADLMAAFFSPQAKNRLSLRSGREVDVFRTTVLGLAIFFMILAAAGPEWGEKLEPLEIRGVEMLFLLDTSDSMAAEDLKPNRLAVARQLINGAVDSLDTDYVSLVNFAGTAYIQCPLTIDYEAFRLMAQASTFSPGEEQGTDFAAAFRLGLKIFAEESEAKRIIVMITDGEDQEGDWLSMVNELKKRGIILLTVGVGAGNGAPIPVRNDSGQLMGWKKDRAGQIIKTRLDEKNLIRIASATGGQYFRLSGAAAVDRFLQNLDSFERKVLKKRVRRTRVRRFQYPLLIGIMLLVAYMMITVRKVRWTRN